MRKVLAHKKWASPKKGATPVKSRRRSLSRPSVSSLASTARKGGGLAANIKVAVRVRPENERELAGNYDNVIKAVDKNMLIFDPKESDDTFFFKGRKQQMRDLNKKQKKDKTFTFDNVYDEESTNEQVFEGTTKSIVDTLFDGYNCCVFAYGATGAGKTHTMLGNTDNPGITFLTMKEIFNKVSETDDVNYDIFLSYIEVYNENIRDLMEPSKTLLIREDGKSGTTIAGMTMLKPKSPDEVLSLLSRGNSNRTQHPTDHNKESSRSHAMLQIILTQKPKDAGLSAEVKTAKLSMIDLAGSEKGTATGHKGARFREGSNINKSLLALGNCINALAAGSKYIPYRDSKLTRLLKDSVGGNCATVMIANVSPSSLSYEDTLNTLKYADRAKQIKVDLKKNVVSVDFHVAQYAKIVEDLKGEIDALKQKIKMLEDENESLKEGGAVVSTSVPSDRMSPGGRLSAASSGQPDIDMEDLDSLSKVLQLRQQLSVLIERQKDYDQLQLSVTNHQTSHKQLEEKNADLQKENTELKSKLETLQQQLTAQQQNNIQEKTDAVLEELMRCREATLETIGNERSLLSVLQLRVHYKTLQAERCNILNIRASDKEKSELKMNRKIESLKKKAEKKSERVAALLVKFNEENMKIQQQMKLNPTSISALSASHRLSLEEHKTENVLLHCVFSFMEREMSRLENDFTEILPNLVWKEKLLRGNGISSQEDKEAFARIQARIQSSESISFSDSVNTSVNEELERTVLKKCCDLNLPSLKNTRRKSSSVEQRILFSDIEGLQDGSGGDEIDGTGFQPITADDEFQPITSPLKPINVTVDNSLDNTSLKDLDNGLRGTRDSIYVHRKISSSVEDVPKVSTTAIVSDIAKESDNIVQNIKNIVGSSIKSCSVEDPSTSTSLKHQTKPINSGESSRDIQLQNVFNKMNNYNKITVAGVQVGESPNLTDEIPSTPQLFRSNSGSMMLAGGPGVQIKNKSFLDRLPVNDPGIKKPTDLNSTVTLDQNSDKLDHKLDETVTLDHQTVTLDPQTVSLDHQSTGSNKRHLVVECNTEDCVESPGKKARLLNETYNHQEQSDAPSAWTNHRRFSAIPDSPLVIGQLSPLVIGQLANSPSNSGEDGDSTFTRDDEGDVEQSNGQSADLPSDTLLEQLDVKGALQFNTNSKSDLNSTCVLDAPTAKLTLPSTRDVSDEPMEVDQTVNINDISSIPSPDAKSKDRYLNIFNKSPVKSKMGSSPKYVMKRNTPSPLRESTLLDLKKKDAPINKQKLTTASSDYSAVKSSGYGVQSINKNKLASSNKGRPGLSSSKSTSALIKPAAAHKLNLPPNNQQSALANRGRSPGALKGAGATLPRTGSPNYAQSTMASSNKSSTLERRPKGTENQKPGLQIKSGTSLKRSTSSVARNHK